MDKNKVKILKNFKDTDSFSLKKRREIEMNSLEYLINSGYMNLDTPILESADLFFKKSLGSTSGNTYTFVDQLNQQVSLRPDFTASIMRYVFSNFTENFHGNGKYCYSGPVFKFENSADSYHQTFQVGAEYISNDKKGYESEVILDAVECLKKNKINDFKINIGNVGILRDYLFSLGLSNTLIEFFLTNIKVFNKENYEDELLSKAKFQNLIKSSEKITNLNKNDIQKKFQSNLQSNLGLRSNDEIIERYLNKLSNQIIESKFKIVIEKLNQLININLNDLLNNSLKIDLDLEYFTKLINKLLTTGISKKNICIDFSLTRNLAYYNGVVFDLICDDKLIGGGGRYDELPSMLGYSADVSCVGFAINISMLTDITIKNKNE